MHIHMHTSVSLCVCAQRRAFMSWVWEKKEKEKKSCLTSPRHHHLKKHRWAKFLKCLPSENVSGEFCQLRNNNSRYCGVRERSVRGFLISAGCHVWNLTELQERERERERW